VRAVGVSLGLLPAGPPAFATGDPAEPGRPTVADTSQAYGHAQLHVTEQQGLHRIRSDRERREIPVAVVLGG
jgi:hypothetical protein